MNGALPLFVEMTGKASDMVKQTGVRALAEFAKHGMLIFRHRRILTSHYEMLFNRREKVG